MTKQYVTISAPEDIIKRIAAAEALDGVDVGSPRAADALTDAVDSPLGPEEIKVILQVVSVGFSTASAALVFFERLKKFLADSNPKQPAPVEVKEGKTRRPIAKIDRNTDPAEVAKKAYK